MKQSSLLLVLEMLSKIQLPPVTDPNFKDISSKFIDLKEDVERELDANNNNDIAAREREL